MPVENPSPSGNIFLDAFFEPDIDPNFIPPTGQINGSGSGTAFPDGVGDPNVPTTAERADALFPFFDGVNARLTTNPISQDGRTEYLFPATADAPAREPTLTPAFDANGLPLEQRQLFENAIPIPQNPADLPIADFLGFHSSHQLEYVLLTGQPVPGSPDARIVTFEQDGNRFDVVAIPGERRIFVLQQLTKTDLAITAPEIEEVLANALGTLPGALREQIERVVGASTGSASTAALTNLIDNALAQINGVNGDGSDGFFTLAGFDEDDVSFSAAQIAEFKAVFADQIENIRTRADQSSFFDLTEISTRIEEIVRRADRAHEFFVVTQFPPEPVEIIDSINVPPFFGDPGGLVTQQVNTAGQNTNVNAPAGADTSQSGIASAFDTFIAQETRVRDLDNQRLQLANSGVLNGGRALDGPNLIAIFQLNYNLTREAEVNLETEELNQQNALLQIYSKVQQLVNDALARFSVGEDGAEEERTINGSLGRETKFNELSDDEKALIAFIDTVLVGESAVGHPIETLRNIDRPTKNIIERPNPTTEIRGRPIRNEAVFPPHDDLNRFSQNSLNIFASQLADTVTQINQESQILTNEISSINRERNRNFDLANNALRRLNDTLLTIARA